MDTLSKWPDLIPDMLLQIASKLTSLEDFMAMRGICSSWRACITRDKFTHVSKVPLLMLGEKEGNDDVRELYSLSKKRVSMRIAFPEARGRKCICAGFGWNLIAPERNSHGELVLLRLGPPLNSLRRRKIQLPSTEDFPGYKAIHDHRYPHFIRGAVLSENPSETSDFVLMVYSYTHLGLWRNDGKNCWTDLNMMTHSICYNNKKMYALDYRCCIWVWDLSANMEARIPVFTVNYELISLSELIYLGESSKGELLLITRQRENFNTSQYGIPCFRVVRLDICGETDNLGGDAVFLGLNSAVSVAADDYPDLIKPNCIYYDTGSYDFNECRIESFDVESFSFICSPVSVWIFPS